MKKIYMILSEQYMPSIEGHTPFGLTEFIFSSKEKALKQMKEIKRLIDENKWYSDGKHNVDYFKYHAWNTFGLLNTMKVNHSNGTYTIYTLQEKYLNQGYFKN